MRRGDKPADPTPTPTPVPKAVIKVLVDPNPILAEATGATVVSTDQNPFVGVKVAALGQQTRQYHMGPYRMAGFTREARDTLRMNFVDDNGNASVHDGTVTVQHDGEPVPVLE